MSGDRASQSIYRADPDAIWKETVSHEDKAKRMWEEEWGFLVKEYKKCHMDSAEVDVIKTEALEEKSQRRIPQYPITSSKHVGWLSAQKELNYDMFGEDKKPISSLHKRLDWPLEGCP